MFRSAEEKKTFTCPFCGMTYKKSILEGTVHLSCHCGATFFLSPELGGSAHNCSNHQKRGAIGLCNDCGRGYCDRCLYVLTFDPFSRVKKSSDAEKKIYLCSNCMKRRKTRIVIGGMSLGILLLSAALLLSPYISIPTEGFVPDWQIATIGFVVVAAALGIIFLTYGWMSIFIPEPTVYQKKNP